MKKLSSTLSKTLGPVRLYREDVIGLMEVFTAYSEDTRFYVGDYEIEGPQELSSEAFGCDTVDSMSFVSRRRYARLDCSPRITTLHVNNDDLAARGFFETVCSLLHKRGRRGRPPLWAAFALAFATGPLIAVGRGLDSPPLTLAGLVALLLVLLGALLALPPSRLSPKTLIILDERRNRPSFWTRNRDTLITGVITAIVTAVLSWLAFTLAS